MENLDVYSTEQACSHWKTTGTTKKVDWSNFLFSSFQQLIVEMSH